ncbi:MAG: PAC2 family protein [Propionibacteriaceae bacterium]|nr:PAC2 family protein [Propionibacteriaceae bacterium]
MATKGNGPIVVMAFQGWNDAADAATSVIDYLEDTYPTNVMATLDDEGFYDYQMTRPNVLTNEKGERELVWPTVTIELCQLPNREVVLISGPEPNMRWRDFVGWVDMTVKVIKPAYIVLLGAMLSDAPHSRPFEVSGQAPPALAGTLELEPNDYEGPTGIVGIIGHLYAQKSPAKLVTMWVSVPHYTAPPPNPKAGLALVERLATILGCDFDLTQWREDVKEWEAHINELIEDDPDMAEYVASLENQTDAETVPRGTGDKLAAAFEEYLSKGRRGGDSLG